MKQHWHLRIRFHSFPQVRPRSKKGQIMGYADYCPEVRLCWRCDQPLPESYHHNRHMHPECALETTREGQRISRRRSEYRRRWNANHPHKKRDPILGLSPEYVALKLAGKIIIPKY